MNAVTYLNIALHIFLYLFRQKCSSGSDFTLDENKSL